MAQEIVYADLNIPSSSPGCREPLSSQPLGPPQVPQGHRTVLGIGSIVLLIAVIALGIWVSQLVSEEGQTPGAPDSHGAGSGDTCTANCSACLQRFRSQLTQRLCHPARPGPAGPTRQQWIMKSSPEVALIDTRSQAWDCTAPDFRQHKGGSGCKLCPSDWRLRGDKCYWVSGDSKTWNESRTDCSARGSRLLVIRDREELEFLKDLTQGSNQFWVGLSIPSPEKAWAWLDGSHPDPTLSPVPGQAEGNNCGVVKGNQIRSDSCSSAFQRICQQDAFLL